MTNQGDNEPWPPFDMEGEKNPPLHNDPNVVEETSGSQVFDGVSKLIVYIVGIGVALCIAALFGRVFLWILGIAI